MTRPGRVEVCSKRIRAYLGDAAVADSTHVRYVWTDRPYPTYYFPIRDVRVDLLDASGIAHLRPDASDAELRDHIALPWGAIDHWFEEDEEVYVHARDPYTRVDILPSSRAVRVEVDGVTIAASGHPTLLFETHLPTRIYFAATDVRTDLLVPTDRVTACPYKGTARYWSVRAGERLHPDLAWAYDAPLPESARIAGLIAFYNERIDLVMDGEHRPRPGPRFS